ncbi:phosphoribosylformylglycinamidine cyclo-ligase [Lentilactobacillus sp. Marseille-Q4993]|uniref:phosphoribosylformylglycinamidine cyclo-ligase n=1 Tax=Lentilactobacillus sp. Marseille-Q4993 TaxID=3039492 RepID=UPI0024BC71A7|nr:phosphoribosylformylglycinamidine cyclo-ligase [Lentilactobacillus sp. Marseille-Q4993]
MDAYKKAGVDIDAGEQLVDSIKEMTHDSGLGAFGGMLPLKDFMTPDPVLVSGTDGVGTKLLVANQANKHNTIGIDLVAMCVNDVLAQGAKPLFFLDYLGTGALKTIVASDVIAGVVEGTKQAGAKLIGGETAEMPAMYGNGHYDLAGFAVGIADRSALLDKNDVAEGDVLIGIDSNGLHSNGYSLVRDILFNQNDVKLTDIIDGHSYGEELLRPTRIYVNSVLPLIQDKLVVSAAHITGGGLLDNVARILPTGLNAEVDSSKWKIPAIMTELKRLGGLSATDMERTFNLGIGFVLVVKPEKVDEVLAKLANTDNHAQVIGSITQGSQKVIINGDH